jgi:hypothetical protein
MPFPFTLPTTSHLNLQLNFTSSTHPSFPATATSKRSVLRSALKSFKRLPSSSQPTHLNTILSALNDYLPYLLSLDAGLSGRPVSGEDIDVALIKEVPVEWRQTLSSTPIPGREPPRIVGHGLDYEIHSVLQTLATTHNLLARQSLLGLYAATTPTPEQRLAFIQSALTSLKTANSLHLYLTDRTTHSLEGPSTTPPAATDISPAVQSALSALSLAEATLLFVLKDDPYPSLLIQSRNKADREWMIKAPEIPRLRVGLFARLCLAGAAHAGVAAATLTAECRGKVDGELIKYCEDLRRSSRAKACRFLGIERDMEGCTGEGIAWLRGGMHEVGMDVPGDEGKSRSGAGALSEMKRSWHLRREDRRVEKGGSDWGADAGVGEEGRVLEWLERQWTKMNDTVNVQVVPDWRPLVAAMPGGREAVAPRAWMPALLGEDELVRLRGPAEGGEADGVREGRSSSEEEDGEGGGKGKGRAYLVGAFPGTSGSYY